MMKRFVLPFLLLSLLFGASCKKDPVQPSDDGRDPDKEILLRDSTYYYSLALSLWEDQLPQPKVDSKGQPDLKAFTNAYQDAEGVLAALKRSAPEDRFSFVDREGTVSEEIQQGVHKETGIVPIFITVSNQNNGEANMYVKYVQKNSPGEKAGLKRGMRIVSINGDSNLDYNKSEQKAIENYYKVVEGKETLNLVVQAPGETTTKTVSVSGGAYNIDPILVKKIFTINGKKIGYIFYTSFVNVFSESGPNGYHTAMTNAFKEFETANVNELIIDLRYNGGGSTSTAEMMSNLLVPTAGSKGKMYDYKINKNLKEWGWDDETNPKAPFRSVNFNKTNALNLQRVYFLGTTGTASASELVMNVLKPYMDVQIITTNGKGTYGKPVGFFGYPVVHGYADLYITSFQMLNKDGFGDYFDGLKGKITNAADGFFTELGDEREALLATAISDITGTGAGARASSRSTKTGLEGAREIKVPELNDHRNNMYKFPDLKLRSIPKVD